MKRYFLGRPLGSVSARAFLRHAAKQWDFFQQTLATPMMPAGITPLGLSGETAGVLPLMADAAAENATAETPAATRGGSIFDSSTAAQMKLMAEGLAEPTPALPQQDEAPLLPAAAPWPVAGMNGNGKHPPPPSAIPAGRQEVEKPSQFSPRSAGAFENLREMLGKLRQPSAGQSATDENGAHTVAERLAGVLGTPAGSAAAPAAAAAATTTTTTTSLLPAYVPSGKAEPAAEANPAKPPPPPPTGVTAAAPAAITTLAGQHAERDALLGRYEALRLQMAAEAVSLPLDYAKLADLIRLAGKRFPLVRFSEHELPGMTGRYAMCWSLQGLELVFGLADFSDGSYWRTLAGYAAGRLAEVNQDAQSTGTVVPKLKITTFKTDREQQSWAILQHSTALCGGAEAEHRRHFIWTLRTFPRFTRCSASSKNRKPAACRRRLCR